MADKRLRYYTGQFLQEQDFNDEQAYFLDRLRRHNRQQHTPGITEGLTATANLDSTEVTVGAGTAVDSSGRSIVLTEPRTLSLGSSLGSPGPFANRSVLVVISYHEAPSDPAAVGDQGETRWSESPRLEIILDSPEAPAADVAIRLARIQVNGVGRASLHDSSVRLAAGVRLGSEVSVERLRLSRQGVAESSWPLLTSGATSRLDLQGSLAVSGDLTVGSTNSNVGNHIASRSNPHGVNAAQVGALVSVAGVSNPGGNISVTGMGGITVTGNDSMNDIRISTSLADLGALPSNQYDFGRRLLSQITFATPTATGNFTVTDTVSSTLNFQPRFIWATGAYYAPVAGANFGSTTNGFAELEASPFVQRGTGMVMVRLGSIPYQSVAGVSTDQGIVTFSVRDESASPVRGVEVQVRVNSLSATSVTYSYIVSLPTNATQLLPGLLFNLNVAYVG